MPKIKDIKRKLHYFFHDSDFQDVIYGKKLSELKKLCLKRQYIDEYYLGNTPLQFCILYRFDEGAMELLKNGAKPNLPSKTPINGETTLQYAINSNREPSLIRLLASYGATASDTVNFKSKENETAYQKGHEFFEKKKSLEDSINNKDFSNLTTNLNNLYRHYEQLIQKENNPIFKTHYGEIVTDFQRKIADLLKSSNLSCSNSDIKSNEKEPLLSNPISSRNYTI